MKINYLFLALSFLAMSACNVTKESVPVDSTVYQGFDNGTTNGKELPIDSFDIVPLETNPSVLLSYIKNVEVNDSIIFVQDAKKHLIELINGNEEHILKIYEIIEAYLK